MDMRVDNRNVGAGRRGASHSGRFGDSR
jgi:hypothetical protein